MDYPKSVPSVGLVNSRFVDENPVAGTPGSLIPAVWGNSVTEELLAVITAAGMTPSENVNDQLLAALKTLLNLASPMSSRVTEVSTSKALMPEELGLVLISASATETTITLPAASSLSGVRDVVVRRTDNSVNRLVVQASGNDRIKFHTHLSPNGYPFLVLMGGRVIGGTYEAMERAIGGPSGASMQRPWEGLFLRRQPRSVRVVMAR